MLDLRSQLRFLVPLPAEAGFRVVTLDQRGMGESSARLGIRPPSLYKHVAGLADLQHQLATRAVLRGYRIAEADLIAQIRAVRCTLHGWCILQVTNSFQ